MYATSLELLLVEDTFFHLAGADPGTFPGASFVCGENGPTHQVVPRQCSDSWTMLASPGLALL